MSEPRPYIAEQNSVSLRHAFFEDDGATGWLYLSAARERQFVADVFVYNRRAPTDHVDELKSDRPPPIISKYAGADAVVVDPETSVWRLRWSSDGDSVALARDGSIVALLWAGQRRGYSAAVNAECPWGIPLRREHVVAAGLA